MTGLLLFATAALAGDPTLVQVHFEADRPDLVVSQHWESTSSSVALSMTVGWPASITTGSVVGLCTIPCTVSMPARIYEFGVQGKSGLLLPAPVELRQGEVTLMAHTLDRPKAKRQRLGAYALLAGGGLLVLSGAFSWPIDDEDGNMLWSPAPSVALLGAGHLLVGGAGLRARQLKRRNKEQMYWEVRQGDARAH